MQSVSGVFSEMPSAASEVSHRFGTTIYACGRDARAAFRRPPRLTTNIVPPALCPRSAPYAPCATLPHPPSLSF
jgi:hypothetical protein